MTQPSPISGDEKPKKRRKKRKTGLRSVWRKVREPLARSRVVKSGLTALLTGGIRFIERSNRRVAGSQDPKVEMKVRAPAIFAFWHGQHVTNLALNPGNLPLVALFSRSADAELNAMVAERLGVETVRGSGGRDRDRSADKGGARALIALRNALRQGKSVCMIADIPHATPRDAGPGIVMLARISGCPIVPMAYATSRRRVLEKSWDKTTINLPFGRAAIRFGETIHVPADADDAALEACRRRVTDELNRITGEAYALVDAPR